MLSQLVGGLAALLTTAVFAQAPAPAAYGIELSCDDTVTQAAGLAAAQQYLAQRGIAPGWIATTPSAQGHGAVLSLQAGLAAPSTRDIWRSSQFGVTADVVELLDPRREVKPVATVSQKEILLALLHPGRLTRFQGPDCGLSALQDQVGVRQTIVAWAQTISFEWPEGGPAVWNAAYWRKGTPVAGAELHTALTDLVMNPGDYAIGCYTAAKAIITAGVLDYYQRIKRNPEQAARVKAALLLDGDPLVSIEPGAAWRFEQDHDPADDGRPGKLLQLHDGVAPGNFVPGDWFYLLNTDPASYQKTGYEGSNAIYLGMGRFSDYYNDHEHSYSFEQKLHEVYQWRHGVFSRSRDAAKVVPLTTQDFVRLARTPEEGGLLLAHRLVPKSF